MTMIRRDFLASSAIGVGSMLMQSSQAFSVEEPQYFNPYEKITLGKSKIKTSRVGLGTGMRGFNGESNHTRMGKEKFEALLKGVFERGITLFDLADLYGTHPYLIPALKGIPRDKFQIVSKIWFMNGGIRTQERPDADVVVERFLKEMKTDYIDILQIHCMTSDKWTKDMDKQMKILEKLKKEGKIRSHGVSCHSLKALELAAKNPWIDIIHTRINPYGTKMDGPADKVVPVLKTAAKNGKGVIGMKIIGEGQFRNSDEKKNTSIDFVMNLDCVDAIVVGCENLKEVDDLTTRIKQTTKKIKPKKTA